MAEASRSLDRPPAPPPTAGPRLVVWRHPPPRGAAGRCIGRSDLPLDPRKAKRLAHRMRRRARREGWPAEVWTSPLERCASVGRWLARWGWTHRVDTRLLELDFGRWEGRCWSDIGKTAVDAWCADFAHHAPGGGEALSGLFERCSALLGALPAARPLLVVGHAGWINAARRIVRHEGLPAQALQWPPAVAHGAVVEL